MIRRYILLVAALTCAPHSLAESEPGITLVPIEEHAACVRFKEALSEYSAAYQAAQDFVGERPWPYTSDDSSPEARAWYRTKRALLEGLGEAWRTLSPHRQAVLDLLIEEEDAAVLVVDEFLNVWKAMDALEEAIHEWRSGIEGIYWLVGFIAVDDKMSELQVTSHFAYDEALKLACELRAGR